jgi:peptide/nickel transport system substrate-binding protein
MVGALPVHLDPQRVRTETESNVSRLITRTLTMYRTDAGGGLVGDLATDAGRATSNSTIWEFTLKPGLRWADGAPLTCYDVKYGVERGYSGLVGGVQPYPRLYLVDNATPYSGPYTGGNNAGRGLESARCVDARTIRFSLRAAVADFGAVVSTPAFAPVPAEQDKKEAYDARPVASGPYQVGERAADHLVLIRNPAWSADTDRVRRAYPDQLVLTVDRDPVVTTANLLVSEGEWANSMALDVDVASTYIQQIRADPALASRLATGSSNGVRYLAVNARRLTDQRCRQALAYAFNRRKFRDAAGGAPIGQVATSMLAPELVGNPVIDPFGVRDNPGGRPNEATRLMAEAEKAGAPCPTSIQVGYPDQADVRRVMVTLVAPYAAIGIQIRLNPIDPVSYWDVVGASGGANDLMYASWVPPWPSAAAVLAPLFDGRSLGRGAPGTDNLAQLNDPEVNAAITAAIAEAPGPSQDRRWVALDLLITQRAVAIPALRPKPLRLAGVNIRGNAIASTLGQPDLCSVSLAAPTTR